MKTPRGIARLDTARTAAALRGARPEDPFRFWVDGPTPVVGTSEVAATFVAGDGVRINGELVDSDLWHWLSGVEGTWVGFLGYAVQAPSSPPTVSPLARTRAHSDSTVPDALWIRADHLLDLSELVTTETGAAPARLFDGLIAAELASLNAAASPAAEEQRYLAALSQIRGHLARGESYEVCMTRQVHLPPIDDPLALFGVLRETFTTSRSVFISTPDLAIASGTPEEFISVTPEGRVTSSPIKGTARRSSDPIEDAKLAQGLIDDPKTRAENLMIVDLVRNDLNQVCEPGSVEVPRFLEVESYPGVHQLVSTVTGQLAIGRSRIDAIEAAFPPGSMTGAPKERTMAIIDSLEVEPRGVYSGAIGVLGADGSADLRVVIRTAVCTPAETTLGTGGAVTWSSDPGEEWRETVLKTQAVLAAYARVGKNGSHG